MQFENAFDVDGTPADVIAVFDDVPLLASFLPGASVGERREDGSYPGQLAVAFGPKRLTFKGTLANNVDRAQLTGELTGQASADVRGAKMLVAMRYRLSPAAQGTRVDIVSEAELTGILAEFARTGGVVVTQALLEVFAQNLSAHMRAIAPAPPAAQSVGTAAPRPPPAEPRAPAKPLSGFALLMRMLKSLFARILRRR